MSVENLDAGRRYTSLDEAIRDRQIPLENVALIRAVVEHIGIVGYYEGSGCIRAVRADGERDLQIHYGYTNGLLRPDELDGALPPAQLDVWESKRGWGVSHPINKMRDSGGGAARREGQERAICPTCHQQYAANGACSC